MTSNYSPTASGWAIMLLCAAERASKPSVFNPYYGTDAPPAAPRGSKKAFILDPLLD